MIINVADQVKTLQLVVSEKDFLFDFDNHIGKK